MSASWTALADGECREFELPAGEGTSACFVVRYHGRFYGYRNQCPHRGAPLNWQPHQFLTVERDMIQCALHGALFRIEDGSCVYGPCAGSRLEPINWPPEQSDG